MKSSTGRWVSGEDFFDRESELSVLENRIRERNHVLLAGQRRLGKTSIVRELGRRLESDGWIFLFVDVEGASRAEDVIADIAQAAYPYRSVVSRFGTSLKRWFGERIEEVGSQQFRVKVRAGLHAGSWRRYGEGLFRDCSQQDKPILLVIDELPIFLKRMVRQDGNSVRADEFLSWLRSMFQSLGEHAPVLVVSGSIGLEPLVRRLGIPDRINYLDTFRLGPWDRNTSIACFEHLAESHGLMVEKGVANAIMEDVHGRIAETLDVLVHDGYLECRGDDHRFASHLLRDWWSSRFRSHHEPLLRRGTDNRSLESAP